MLTIYHVPQSRSMRLIWLCEELGHPYEAVTIDFSPAYRNSEEWRRISPTGKVPAMTDGEVTMFESGAMLQYLLARYGRGRLEPEPGTAEHALYLQWCWFSEATLARPLGDMVHHLWIKDEEDRIPAVVEDAEKRARVCLEALEQAMSGKTYLLGDDFTAADIMTGYALNLARRLEVLDERYPELGEYFLRLSARPGFSVAVRP